MGFFGSCIASCGAFFQDCDCCSECTRGPLKHQFVTTTALWIIAGSACLIVLCTGAYQDPAIGYGVAVPACLSMIISGVYLYCQCEKEGYGTPRYETNNSN